MQVITKSDVMKPLIFILKKKIKNVCYVFNRKSCAQVNNCLGIASIMTTND